MSQLKILGNQVAETLPSAQPASTKAGSTKAGSSGRRYYIETWGCQMNDLDSQRMAGQLMTQGLLPTEDPEEADVILLNSCSIREKAENKVYSRLGRFRRFKQHNPDLLLGLCGCVAQQEGERALDRVADLDFVLGPARVGELGQILEQRRAGERVVATGFPEDRTYDFDAIDRDGIYKGMVTIIEGCNKRCTFCIVPSTRGPERCRPFAEILSEVRHLLSFGFIEIELLGQTVNHWRDPHDDLDFADLLDAVARLEGLRRLRFVTSYPRDFTPAMVEQFALHENICPYLHLPVQSGSDRVLKRMGRGYEVAPYRELIASIRRARPGIALSTDLIVGFPGETDEDFAQTLELARELRYASIFAFKYSPRPGTAAPRLNDPVDDEVASRRLQELFELQTSIQFDTHRRMVGERHELLVTGWSKEVGGSQMGRTPCHRIVHFPLEGREPVTPGTLVEVEINHGGAHSLRAALVEERPAPPRRSTSGLAVISS